MNAFDKLAGAYHYAGGMTMKKTMKRSRLITTMLALCILFVCMAFAAEPAMAATTPNYIASIGVAQDGSSGSTGINDCKNELSGHIIIDRDLNDDAGGDYVYMGYKTTTDPSQAIRGIVFRVGGNPPSSITYNGYTFYLVGGEYETNTAKLGGYIDLNGRAGGVYIYTYVTRAAGYGAPLTAMTVNESSSYSGWITGTNTNGSVINLNQEAGGNVALYLHYQRFSGTAQANYHYLTSAGARTSSTQSGTVKTHTETMTKKPSYATSVTYDGRTFSFKGWREDNTATSASTTSPSVTYMTSPKTYRAVYSGTLGLSYNANGGSGAPSSQTATQYINAGSSSVSKQSKTFTLSSTRPTPTDKCAFLGWSTSSSATSASYAPGGSITISSNTTLYAVWKDHSYTNNVCTACGTINPAITTVATLTKNGKLVGAYATLDEAITAAESCTADDKAVVQLQKDIALGDAYQDIEGGVFTLDLNGYTISCTSESRYALALQNTGTNVVITSSRKGGTILSAYYGINASSDTALTVSDVAIIAEESGIMLGTSASISNVSIDAGVIGIWARNSSTVTVTDCTIEAGMFALYIESKVTATITGGSYTGGDKEEDIYVTGKATVSGAAFPGGIAVDGKPLSAILAAGQAYWAGDTMIVPAANQKAIAGRGDITVKAACTHAGGTKQDYVNNGDDHRYAYSCCGAIYTEAHAYSAENGLCPCGAINPDAAVIITKNDAVFGAYTTLDAAITAAEGSTADDNAVAQLQKDIDLSDGYQDIDSGVFTIDLNGCAISSTSSDYGALRINSADANVTIQDSGEGGRIAVEHIGIKMKAGTLTVLSGDINSNNYGVYAENSTVTIRGGTVSGDSYGVFVPNYSSTVTISGGTVSGGTYGVYAESSSTVTISGGTVSGGSGVYAYRSTATISGGYVSGGGYGVYAQSSTVTISGGAVSGGKYGMYACDSSDVTISGGTVSGDGQGMYARNSSTVTISGGSISGAGTDICNYDATVTLTMGENGEGPSFPGGVELKYVTLNEILGEGAAYWAGDRMIVLSDGQTEITGMGDITVKAECKHEGGTKLDYVNNGDDHGFTYSCCGTIVTEPHSTTAEGDRAATCTEPAYCTVCENEYGETESHSFADGACTVCGVTGGYCGAEANEGGAESIVWTYADGALIFSGNGAVADLGSVTPWYEQDLVLTSVTVGEGITTLPSYIISDRHRTLTTINLPASLTTLPDNAIYDAMALMEIRVASGNTTYKDVDGCLLSNDGKTFILYPYGRAASSYRVPDGVETIRFKAFLDSNLTEIIIPDSVTSIEAYAFSYCRSLSSVTLSANLTSIGNDAFRNCSSLKTIAIPKGVTSIGVRAFYDCSSLTDVTILEGVTHIGVYTFRNCRALSTVTLPASLTRIESNAFENCDALTTVNVPCTWDGSLYTFADGVTVNKAHSFTEGACSGCGETLEGIMMTLPASLTVIDAEAFLNTAMQYVQVPEGTLRIEERAFAGSDLRIIRLPDSIEFIADNAFDGCENLVIEAPEGSYAYEWAAGKGYQVQNP